jgi:phosphosulfolactate phosphohydrolase-like enzyme
VEPTVKLAGEAGDTAIEDSVGAGAVVEVVADVDVDEQDAMTIVKAAINPMVRQ